MSKSVKISRVVKSSRDKKSLNKNINKSGSKTIKKQVYQKQNQKN